MANDALARAATSVFGESNLPATRSVFTPAAFGQAIDIRQRAALAKKYVDSAAGLYDFETKLRDQQLQRRQQGLKAADVTLSETLLPQTQDTAIKESAVNNAMATESAATIPTQIDMLRTAQQARFADFKAKIAEQEREAQLNELQPKILEQVESYDLKDPTAIEGLRSSSALIRDPRILQRLNERLIVAQSLSQERERYFRSMQGAGVDEKTILDTEDQLADMFLNGERNAYDLFQTQQPTYNERERAQAAANKAVDKRVARADKVETELQDLQEDIPPGVTAKTILADAGKLIKAPDDLKAFEMNPEAVAARLATIANGSGTSAKNPAHPELVVLAKQLLKIRKLQQRLTEKMLNQDTGVAPASPRATSAGSTPGGSALDKFLPGASK